MTTSGWLQIVVGVLSGPAFGYLVFEALKARTAKKQTQTVVNQATPIAVKQAKAIVARDLHEEIEASAAERAAWRAERASQDRMLNQLLRNIRRHQIWDQRIVADLREATHRDYPEPPDLLEGIE